jgi:type IV secretion system protein TrbL
VAALALILLPFGVNRHTAFLGEKAIGAVLSFGIKLMVLAFIAAVAVPLVKTWSLPVDPTNKQMFCLLLGSLAITFLAWHAPTMAAGLLSGHPTLTAGTAAGFGAAGAAATVGLGWASAALGRAGIRTGHRATMAATRGGGQISEAYRSGGIEGIRRLGEAYVSKGTHKISDPFTSSFDLGKKTVASMLDDSGGPSTGTNSGGRAGSCGNQQQTPKMDFDRLARKIRYVHNSVPPSHGEGGGSAKPNLKGGDES